MKGLLKGGITDLGVPQTPSASGGLLGVIPPSPFKARCQAKVMSCSLCMTLPHTGDGYGQTPGGTSSQQKREFRALEWLKLRPFGGSHPVPTTVLKPPSLVGVS